MIELLILHELNKKILTMYGISKEIRQEFSVLTTPSYGTIKPALKRLESSGFLKTQKSMTEGGRPSTFYSISNSGKEELKRLILLPPLDNPIQFFSSARIKLYCANILNKDEQQELFKLLKYKSESVLIDVKNILENKELDFFGKMVFDNMICEYKNFISLLEGLTNACKN